MTKTDNPFPAMVGLISKIRRKTKTNQTSDGETDKKTDKQKGKPNQYKYVSQNKNIICNSFQIRTTHFYLISYILQIRQTC